MKSVTKFSVPRYTHAVGHSPGSNQSVEELCPYNQIFCANHQIPTAKGFQTCSIPFGLQVDNWLQRAVEHGWLDWGASSCDLELEMEWAQTDSPARAAWEIWSVLVRRGFIATSTQEMIQCPAYGLAPVLDLKGFNHKGETTIVEVKTGWAHSAAQGTTQFLPPFDHVNSNHRNMALLQLAMQVACARENGTDVKTDNAWIVTLAPLTRLVNGAYKHAFDVIVVELKDGHLQTAEAMLHEHSRRFSNRIS